MSHMNCVVDAIKCIVKTSGYRAKVCESAAACETDD